MANTKKLSFVQAIAPEKSGLFKRAPLLLEHSRASMGIFPLYLA
jgi:hypothetical protein